MMASVASAFGPSVEPAVARARPVEEALFVAESFAYHVAEEARRFRLRVGPSRDAALRLHLDARGVLQKVSLSRVGVAPALLFVAVYDGQQAVGAGDAGVVAAADSWSPGVAEGCATASRFASPDEAQALENVASEIMKRPRVNGRIRLLLNVTFKSVNDSGRA